MDVNFELRGPVAWLTLDDPDRLNPLGPDMKARLSAHLRAAEDDPEVRCVVITGAGRAFCAGGDVGAGMGERTPLMTSTRMFHTAELINQIVSIGKPTVAALNGLAVGAGASLALCADVCLMMEGAYMSFMFVDRGLVPDFASTYFLPRIVGISRAKDLMLTARRVSSQDALAYGLASAVFSAADFDTSVQRYAERIASSNITVMPFIRRLVNHSFDTDFRGALEKEALAQSVAASTEEHRQAVAAFKARRA